MILDLIVKSSDDGFTAVIPSIAGCDNWAHEEDDAIKESVSFLRYYLKLPEETEIKIDMARKEKSKSIYKLVFDKNHT